MKATSIQRTLLIVVLIIASQIFAAAQTQMYELYHLGISGSIGGVHQPLGISASGTVVGYNELTDAAFRWNSGNLSDLTDTRTLYTPSQATGISENGAFVAVGSANGAILEFESNGGTSPGHYGCLSRSVNDSGLVVGQMPMTVNGNPETRAFSATPVPINTAPVSLGTFGGSSVATAVNNSGQIVGYSANTAGFTRAFFMNGGVMTDFEPGVTTYDNWAYAINDIGTIVGASDRFICRSRFERWVCRGPTFPVILADQAFFYLGSLGGLSGVALGINNAGTIVGWSLTASGARHAFYFTNGQMVDINTSWITNAVGWTITEAWAINDNGYIVGHATSPSGQDEIIVLRPLGFAATVFRGLIPSNSAGATYSGQTETQREVVGRIAGG